MIAGAGGAPLQPVYAISGEPVPEERVIDALPGYRGMGPVRAGNQAARQTQHDVYGWAILAATRMLLERRSLPGDTEMFRRLEPLGERAAELFDQPDAGLWELRGAARVHTFSSVMCWAGCDRLARIATVLGLAERAAAWRRRAEHMHRLILEHGGDAIAREQHVERDSGLRDSRAGRSRREMVPPRDAVVAEDARERIAHPQVARAVGGKRENPAQRGSVGRARLPAPSPAVEPRHAQIPAGPQAAGAIHGEAEHIRSGHAIRGAIVGPRDAVEAERSLIGAEPYVPRRVLAEAEHAVARQRGRIRGITGPRGTRAVETAHARGRCDPQAPARVLEQPHGVGVDEFAGPRGVDSPLL